MILGGVFCYRMIKAKDNYGFIAIELVGCYIVTMRQYMDSVKRAEIRDGKGLSSLFTACVTVQ